MRSSIQYSQNFLKDKSLVTRLVEQAKITKDNVVYEIGAGTGIITEELVKKAGKVIAFEIDENLFNKLSTKFQGIDNLVLRNSDFLEQILPSKQYKIFSNIPFNITASIIKKLTQASNAPDDSYLIVQSDAAKKFVGKPFDFKNSQISVLLHPWFNVEVVYKFRRTDFAPMPNVDSVLLRIEKKQTPLIRYRDKQLYEDFVTYTFSQFKPNIVEGLEKVFGIQTMKRFSSEMKFSSKSKPSELEFDHWLLLFDKFVGLDKHQRRIVLGSFAKARRQDQKVEKINRTRVDRNWKTFKK
ncbi:MAG: 23S ribosomal RNA methyltransferase Erm [Patescibacteria group bacterium]